MKMCNVQILLSLSIGVLSLSSVSRQRDIPTNVTANCSGSCGDCTIIECVLSRTYHELSVNDTGKLLLFFYNKVVAKSFKCTDVVY